MRTLLKVVGSVWAIIGVMNIVQSPSMQAGSMSTIGPTFVVLFNACLFILPGLVLAGVGSLIKKADPKGDNRPCPYCAETIKAAATMCRFCNKELQ